MFRKKNVKEAILMKFRAKIDWWMHLIFAVMVITNIGAVVAAFTGNLTAITAIIIAATFTPLNAFLIIPIWRNTYYLVDENNELHIRSGLIKYAAIDVMRITGIAYTWNPISSPALSLARMEISYKYKSGNFNDTILIAPEDNEGFIAYLKNINENIEVFEGKKPLSQGVKVLLIISAVVLVVTLAGTAALFIVGEREPAVTVYGDSVRISAMYGTTVAFDNISEITLLNQSMREIGAGMRTNGYGGAAWRGHFTAGLLFVRPDSSPTIRIERERGSSIFISFRDNAATEAVYRELTANLPAPATP